MDDMVIRYFNLYDSGIKKYCDVIDFDLSDSIPSIIINKLLTGDLDDEFMSKELEGIDDKKSIHNLARKYSSLCFFQGNGKYWRDSIDGVTCQDYDTIMIKLLDNYNFLLKVGINNPAIYSFLTDIQDKRIIRDSSVIDYLRNKYNNDNILLMVLNKMIDDNSVFKDYSFEQRAILCMNPTVILKDNELCSDGYIQNKFDSSLNIDDFSDRVFEETINNKASFS